MEGDGAQATRRWRLYSAIAYAQAIKTNVQYGQQVNIGEAKKHWLELVDRAAAGEGIIIAKRGRPVAILNPLTKQETAKLPAHESVEGV